jgi:hypothetical protein
MADGRQTSGWAAGGILFAGLMMIMVGIWQALEGLIAIFENEFYVATRNYLFQFDATTWGWIHLILGIVVALAGWGLLSGRTWARTVAIILAVLRGHSGTSGEAMGWGGWGGAMIPAHDHPG